LSIEAVANSSKDSTIKINAGSWNYIIDELSGNYEKFIGEERLLSDGYEVLRQSDLTHKMLEQLCVKKSCDLPSFNSSSHGHQIFLQEMLYRYNLITGANLTSLSIT
jgi:hypothetical protein